MSKIVLEHVGKKYGKKCILQDVSVTFSSGNVYGLIGENGAGKTVLLRMICGLSTVTEGTVHCDGKQVGKDVEFLENCGVIIETPGFLLNKTGKDNLLYLDSLAHKPDAEKVKRAMQACGLDSESRKKVGAYSLGMRQRLGIAQAIMDNPNILILDEPTNGLDKQGVRDVCRIIKEAKSQGKLIILASHHMEEIEDVCDKVYRIQNHNLYEYKNDIPQTLHHPFIN